jgi:dienelactone hydrolase
MQSCMTVVAFLMLGAAVGQAASPGPAGSPAGPHNEQVWWVPMEQPRGRGTVHLEATVYRPDGTGPFPLILLNHGSPGDADDRKNPRTRYYEQSRWFVQQGFAVIIPMRRGYAESEGEWSEGYKTCADPDYINAGFTTANDMAAVLKYFSGQTFVDSKRVIVVGQSAGGFGSLALASRNPDGVLGVINFAGGRGAIGKVGSAERVCKDERLVEATARYGKTARLPSLWLYAQNDEHFRPELVSRMLTAYRGAGAPADFISLPPFGKNGHDTFASWSANANWTGYVKPFLEKLQKP